MTLIYVLLKISVERSPYYSLDDTEFEGVLTNLVISENKIAYTIEGKDKLICNYYLGENESADGVRENYRLGSKVKIEGTLGVPLNNTVPNTFNYKKYLNNHGIFYTCNASRIDVIDSQVNFLYSIKNFVVDRIMTFEMKDYMYTLIVGDKSLLDDETFEKYRKNGVTHLFAISGMHIGLFSGVMLSLLKKMRLKKNKRYIITVTFIWFYAFLTGFSSSVLRACVLFSLLSLFKICNLEIETLKVLILTGCLLLFYDCFLIYDIGFIYSFTTTFGLLYSSKIISKHKILGTSLVATLYSLPITIQNFFKVNLLSTFFNIIFVPFVSVIIYPLCLLTFVFKFLSPLTRMSIFFLEMLNDLLAKIDFLYLVIPKMSIWFVVFYYIILMFSLKKKFYSTCVILIVCVLLNKIKPILDTNYYVEFLDVGQGDSAIIRMPRSREVILIDAGGKENFGKKALNYHVSSNTITYLNSLGIDKIDYMILTHGDADHMGDAEYVVNNLKVKQVIFNCGPNNDLENELVELLDKKNIEHNSCIEKLNSSKNTLYFLNTKEYDNENDNSSVIYTEINNYKFLFMGDASSITEKEILNKYNLSNIDVLKVGHHGSKTSSSNEFINTVKPKFSIISVGKNNRYGHPNKEVIDNLENSIIYRTDKHGSVMFKIIRDNLDIKTWMP